jgi:hypothetical protein
MLNTYPECHNAECRYAECRYAECRYTECCGAELTRLYLETRVLLQAGPKVRRVGILQTS